MKEEDLETGFWSYYKDPSNKRRLTFTHIVERVNGKAVCGFEPRLERPFYHIEHHYPDQLTRCPDCRDIVFGVVE